MNYIFYIGLVVVLTLPYQILNIIISIIIGLAEWAIKKTGSLFYLGRVIRVYLYSSLLLTFSNFYIESGLSPFFIISISYLGVMFQWMNETKSGMENYGISIELRLAGDKYKITWFIYSVIFFVMYFTSLPVEPLLSKLLFKLTFLLTDYKFFVIMIILTGLGLLLAIGGNTIRLFMTRQVKTNKD